jgi:hypothetical protein
MDILLVDVELALLSVLAALARVTPVVSRNFLGELPPIVGGASVDSSSLAVVPEMPRAGFGGDPKGLSAGKEELAVFSTMAMEGGGEGGGVGAGWATELDVGVVDGGEPKGFAGSMDCFSGRGAAGARTTAGSGGGASSVMLARGRFMSFETNSLSTSMLSAPDELFGVLVTVAI